MRKILIPLVVCALALLPSVFAEGADWLSVPVHYSWDFSMGGFCRQETQCLLHLDGNANYDGDLSRWFRLPDYASSWPHCINDSQFLLDYRCENGNWTTRTKRLALQLLQFADTNAPDNFTLFCDTYSRVLNQFQYFLQNVLVESYLDESCSIEGRFVPCVNSVCVLRTPTTVAIGTTVNSPINDTSHSFLRALGKSASLCNGVSSASSGFVKCDANEPVWFNPALQAVIVLPNGALAAPASETKLTGPLSTIDSYVMGTLNKPSNPGMNFAYFPKTRLFNHLYAAQDGGRGVFSFLENIRPETADGNPTRLDYIGVRYTGIDLGKQQGFDPCLNIVKAYDDNAFCENQTGSGFDIIARHRCEETAPNCKGASPIVGAWPALSGKLRP